MLITLGIASFAAGEVHTLNKRVNVLEKAVVCLIQDDNAQTSMDTTILHKFQVLFHRDTVWYDKFARIKIRLNEDSVALSKPRVRYNFYFSDSTKVSFTGLGEPTKNGFK